MKITYNGLTQPSNLITFTDIPNILKVEDTGGGTYATFKLTFSGNLKSSTTIDGQWYITFLGESVTNVVDYNNAVNKNFYVSTSPQSTAASVASALRNCPTVLANFTIEHNSNEVVLKARAVGRMWTGMRNYYGTNISSTYLTNTASDGNANSQLAGAVVNVDVIADSNYLTSLSKSYYGSECAFDMSPVLTTIAQIGRTVPYSFKLSYTKEGEYTSLGNVTDNSIAQGYMVNQGAKYLTLPSNAIAVAQNYSRGTSRAVSNSTLLYIYGDTVPVYFYRNEPYSTTIGITYRNSAFEEIASSTDSCTGDNQYNKLRGKDVQLSKSLLNSSFYVDITVGSDTIRYNVIKPVKATEYYQRICWRNSYGGVSFFDFTGQRSETRDVDITTYQKNIFGYYTSEKNELDMVFDNDVKYSVTLKSHLFEHDGKYIFNDLMQSPYVWTEINGEQYVIIIDSVSVEEQDRNDIYEATVKYRYSQKPSLL